MIYFEDPNSELDLLWHLGDPLPALSERRVVRLQADGDELGVILAALRAPRSRSYYPLPAIARVLCPACHMQPCQCERPAA